MAQPTQGPENSRELDRILEFLLAHWSTGRSPPPPGPNTASPFAPTLDDIEEFLVERELVHHPKAPFSLPSQEEKARASDKALQISVDPPSSRPNPQPRHDVVASTQVTTQSHPRQTLIPTVLGSVAADPAGPGLALSLPTLSPGSTWLLVPLSIPIQSPARASAGPKRQERSQRCPEPGCGKAYGRASHLRAHLRCHTGERPFACVWQGCQRRFARSDELSRHCRVHSGQRPHTCSSCPARFARRDHLIKHARSHLRVRSRVGGGRCLHAK
uniref:Krueppel-like factor 13 n=1 Tax=Myxine glutinosa TaxID=7769 RepID=UPI00358F95EC